jgi:hypothetical protein
MGGFIGVIVLFALGTALVTYLLNLIKVWWIKYIIPVLWVVIAVLFIVLGASGYHSGTEWGNTALIMFGVTAGVSAVAGFATAMILNKLKK